MSPHARALALLLAPLLAMVAFTLASQDAAACSGGSCDAGESEHAALLQSRALQRQRDSVLQAGDGSCAYKESVPCPGSGNACAGDQCCPGIPGTNGQTFPCPSAHPDYTGCVNDTKVSDCLPDPPKCAYKDHVKCPGTGDMCSGDQCCPGIPESNGDTFPCPSASKNFKGCVSDTKVADCVLPPLKLIEEKKAAGDGTCAYKDDVKCPGSGNACAGDQCCPGIPGTHGQTFPCPSAHPDYTGCVNDTKVSDCLPDPPKCAYKDHVKCPGTGDMCSGDQCCPGIPESNGDTFPCPSASKNYKGCVSDTKVADCVLPALKLIEEKKAAGDGTCAYKDDVKCPGSGNACAGDQCCPGIAGTNGQTFPCPSAHPDYTGCVNDTKVSDCLPDPPKCEEGAHVKCPGTGNMCAGDQCCPGIPESNDDTFPCPSASKNYKGCVSDTKVADCVLPPL